MIDKHLSFQLPHPWMDQLFETTQIGAINFLVGSNGSGKSQFARSLFDALKNAGEAPRLLGTDRLTNMAQTEPLARYFCDNFSAGFAKGHFKQLRAAGEAGSGIDTIVVLEDRMDLRIQIEATLLHLFGREITEVVPVGWTGGR